jgi:hypothetical protein
VAESAAPDNCRLRREFHAGRDRAARGGALLLDWIRRASRHPRTRRVRGRVVVTEADLRGGHRFEDTIAIGAFPIDVHERRGTATRLERMGGPDHHHAIPPGSLIPVALDNALVAGRGISATHTAFGALRIMPQAMATGQSAGVVAALPATRNSPVHELRFSDVEDGLLRQGAVLQAA